MALYGKELNLSVTLVHAYISGWISCLSFYCLQSTFLVLDSLISRHLSRLFSFRSQQAYICNFRQHWFCVRKLGNQWFNLNSLLTGPELISNTYLSLFLTQLQQEGAYDVSCLNILFTHFTLDKNWLSNIAWTIS